MNQDRTYVFSIDFDKPFLGKDAFLHSIHKFSPHQNSIHVSTPFWPFTKQRPPRIMNTGRTKPIKARLVSWDNKTNILVLTLDRYENLEPNVPLFPFTELHRSQFWIDFEAT